MLLGIMLILVFPITACNNAPCAEESEPYWGGNLLSRKMHNTKIKGENVTIRQAFGDLRTAERNIRPRQGFITLRLHLDKHGNFCEQEIFEIDRDYRPTSFNEGDLGTKLMATSAALTGWSNATETKTYYLIRFKIENGSILEIF
ncbi:hypothetical protein [Maribacter sp. 2307ULW6-5]|uniref:hypothetical protein n=1 Tax=Maribacter sp. 2307ULW6-5 TaxID=3386275 RepID=UPI0039BD2FE9